MTDRKPFDRNGVSEYPPSSSFIGQTSIFELLLDFLADGAGSRPGNFLIYGDWGSGKSRIGHELVAQATRKSKKWQILKNNQFTEQDLLDELDHEVFPVMLPLSDFIDDVTENNAGIKAVDQAIEKVIYSNDRMYRDLKTKLSDKGVDVTELENIKNTTEKSSERVKDYLSTIYNSDIDRLLIIVDEVEEAGSVMDQAPGEVESEGVGKQRLKSLLRGLKRAVNPNREEYEDWFKVDLILLCTPGIERYVDEIGGLERRSQETKIERPTILEAQKFVDNLRKNHDELKNVSDNCVSAMFFASFNNFGWFSVAMYSFLLAKNRDPSKEYYKILRNNPESFQKIFDREYIGFIENDKDIAKDNILDIVYKITPTPKDDLDLGEVTTQDIVGYKDPTGVKPVGEMNAVSAGISEFIRVFTQKYEFEEYGEKDTRYLEYKGDKISVDVLSDILRVFKVGNNKLAIYTSEDDLQELASFILEGQYKEETANKIVDTFKEILKDKEEPETYYAPTIQFLERWSKRWKKVSRTIQWLKDKKWQELMGSVQELKGKNHEEILNGLVYTRFRDYIDSKPKLDSIGLKSPNFQVDIPKTDIVDVVRDEEAIFLYNIDKKQTLEDINKINRDYNPGKPLIYLIFENSSERREVMAEISDSNIPIEHFIIAHVIDNRDISKDLLIKFSFLHDVFDWDDMNLTGQELVKSTRESLINTDKEWLDKIEKNGWLLEPVLPKGKQIDVKDNVIKGINHFMDGGELNDGTFTGDESKNLNKTWEYCWENDRENILLFAEEPNKLVLPEVVPRLLKVLKEKNGLSSKEVAGRFLYASDYRAQVDEVAENILSILEGLGVLTQNNNTYIFNDRNKLEESLKEAEQKIEVMRGKNDKKFDKLKDDIGNQLISEFKVTSDFIKNYINNIDDEKNKIGNAEADILTDIETESEDWYKVAKKAREVSSHAKKGYNPQREFDQQSNRNKSDMSQLADKIESDNSFNKYSIHYRLKYLDYFRHQINEHSEDMLEEVQKKQQIVDNKYDECYGKSFPKDQIKEILKKAEKDLKLEEAQLSEELKIETDKTIRGHLNISEVEKVYSRLSWYNKVLKVSSDGFWSDYENAYRKMEEVLEKVEKTKEKWERANTFLDSSEWEEKFKNKEVEYSEGSLVPENQWRMITDVYEDPAGKLNNTSPSELFKEIEVMEKQIESIQTHIDSITDEAEEELNNKLDELDWGPLKTLSNRINKQLQIDKDEVWGHDRYIEIKNAIEELSNKIDDEGARLINQKGDRGEEFWKTYKRLYNDLEQNDEFTDSKYDKEKIKQINKLNDWGIIDLDSRTVYNVKF